MLSILSSVCWPSVCLWRDVCLGLLLIFSLSWLVHCLFYWAAWVVCIFWRLIPRQLLHLQIFSLFWGCLFVLLMVSFAVQKLLNLSRLHLLIFVFISIILGDGSKKILLWFISESVPPMFSSSNFIVSDLTFRSLIHFVYGVKEWSNFIFLHVAVQFSQRHWSKRLRRVNLSWYHTDGGRSSHPPDPRHSVFFFVMGSQFTVNVFSYLIFGGNIRGLVVGLI